MNPEVFSVVGPLGGERFRSHAPVSPLIESGFRHGDRDSSDRGETKPDDSPASRCVRCAEALAVFGSWS